MILLSIKLMCCHIGLLDDEEMTKFGEEMTKFLETNPDPSEFDFDSI